MIESCILSDQLINWSDIYEKKINHSASAKTKNTPSETSSSRSRSPRFFNRTLQTLWKTWLQMCRWTWPWPKVLLISQQVWKQAPDGLHSTGSQRKCRKVPCKLPKDKDNLRRTLRNQSRAFTSQGKILARPPPIPRGQHDGNVSGRYRRDRNHLSQYA